MPIGYKNTKLWKATKKLEEITGKKLPKTPEQKKRDKKFTNWQQSQIQKDKFTKGKSEGTVYLMQQDLPTPPNPITYLFPPLALWEQSRYIQDVGKYNPTPDVKIKGDADFVNEVKDKTIGGTGPVIPQSNDMFSGIGPVLDKIIIAGVVFAGITLLRKVL